MIRQRSSQGPCSPRKRGPRRLPIVGSVAVLVALVLGGLGLLVDAVSTPAAAEDSTSATVINEGGPAGFVAIAKVSGLLDPVMTDFVSTSIDDAIAEGAVALILQTDSTGVVVDDSVFAALLTKMRTSSVPVDVWVGPSGSRLIGKAAQLVGAAQQVGVAPGSRLGDAGTPVVAGLDLKRLTPIADRTVNAQEAADLGITTVDAPTIGDFMINLPGVVTVERTADNGETRREPLTQVRFGQLSLVSNLMHTVASPAVAYLLLTVGIALIIFELFTAGVGVAGVVGAGAFILSGYGLWVLPTRWWALVLFAVSMLAFTIDVQTGVPRFWTGVGLVAFVVFSFTIYDGFALSWITLLVGIVGVVLAFLGGIPSMVRTRFSTPTIGREWMIGEMGRAVTPVDPDGVVQIRDALWRATTNRSTPIDELDRVRVVSIDGLVLEVEPETGGARDHRERRRKAPTATAEAPGEAPSDAAGNAGVEAD